MLVFLLVAVSSLGKALHICAAQYLQAHIYLENRILSPIEQCTTKKKCSDRPCGKLQLRSTCPEFILTCPDFFLLSTVSPLLQTPKGNHLLISSKYHSVKSLNVYIFIVSGSTLLAQWASCQGDLLAPHKNSLPRASGQGFYRALIQDMKSAHTPTEHKWGWLIIIRMEAEHIQVS